jgi:hypothetical protein
MQDRDEGENPLNDQPENRNLLPVAIGTISAGHQPRPIVPTTLEDTLRFAKALFLGGGAPKSYTSAEQVMVGIIHGLEVGLTPRRGVRPDGQVRGVLRGQALRG